MVAVVVVVIRRALRRGLGAGDCIVGDGGDSVEEVMVQETVLLEMVAVVWRKWWCRSMYCWRW